MTEIPDLRYVNTNDLFTQIITAVGAILAGITLGFTITSYMIYPIKCTSNNNTQTDDHDHDDHNDHNDHDHEEFLLYSDKIGGRCHQCDCCDCLHCAVSDPSGDDDDDHDYDDDYDDDDYDYEKIDKLDETDFDECGQKKRDFITFSNLFFNKLSKMETRDLTQTEIENLRLKTVESDSPYGKIIMTYNSDTDSFWWYSVAQQQQQHSFYIPYKILDTIARLFAITYNCKQICVNYKEEWEKERQLVLEDIEKKQMEAEENKTVMSDAIHFKNFPICVSTLNRFTNKYNLHELVVPATKKKVNEDDNDPHSIHNNNNNNNKIKYSDFKQNIHLLNKKTD